MCLASAAHWRRLAIYWRCIVVDFKTNTHAARYNAWTSAFSALLLNSIASAQPKSEERLAGQAEAGIFVFKHDRLKVYAQAIETVENRRVLVRAACQFGVGLEVVWEPPDQKKSACRV